MADALYDNYRDLLAGNGTHTIPDLDTNDIRVGLRDEGASALNLSTQIDLADVSHVDQSDALAGRTAGAGAPVTGGFDHTDEVITAVSGASIESIDYYDFQTAVNTTSPMIANLDSWTNLPFTPNGGDVTIQPHANGVFAL